MSIVATEIESIHGSAKRMIFYRCQDHLGQWHKHGPVITADAAFDAEAHRTVVAAKLTYILAEHEFDEAME